VAFSAERQAINWFGRHNSEGQVSRAGETMAIGLRIKPPFEVLSEYPVPLSAKEVYTKLNNHHGDQFGKCKITAGSLLQIGKIRILDFQKQHELGGKITFAIWPKQGRLKIKNAQEGKTTLKGITMLLVDADELPPYIQRQLT
jgi:hypothetical protein